MNNVDNLYEPHLTIREFSIPSGKDWQPRLSDWSLIQVQDGVGYWLQAQSRVNLTSGTVLLVWGDGQGRILASQLNSLSLYSFGVTPARLTGLLTLSELDFLKQAASQDELAFQIFPASSPISIKMSELSAGKNFNALSSRLTLLQLFVEIFGKKLEQTVPLQKEGDARERLRAFLMATPPDTLATISFDELARIARCTPRHLSRVFYELVGMSFCDKRAEIRLGRARELLATSQSKVVEVAFESGYKSLSLFNQMFTRRFGISPGKWRQKNGVHRAGESRRNRNPNLRVIRNNAMRPISPQQQLTVSSVA